MSKTLSYVYARAEGCVVHPDDLELCDSSSWSDEFYLEILQEYHDTVGDVRKLYCSRRLLLKEIE